MSISGKQKFEQDLEKSQLCSSHSSWRFIFNLFRRKLYISFYRWTFFSYVKLHNMSLSFYNINHYINNFLEFTTLTVWKIIFLKNDSHGVFIMWAECNNRNKLFYGHDTCMRVNPTKHLFLRVFQLSLLIFSICNSLRQLCLLYEMAKLNSKKRKNYAIMKKKKKVYRISSCTAF